MAGTSSSSERAPARRRVVVIGLALAAAAWAALHRASDEPRNRDRPARVDEVQAEARQSALSRASLGTPLQRGRAVAAFRAQGVLTTADLRDEVATNESGHRGAAAYLLAHVGDEQDRALVARTFHEDAADPAPLLALAAAELRDPTLAAALTRLSKSRHPIVREATATALADTPEPELGLLLQLYADPDKRVRRAASHSLTRLRGRLESDAFHFAVATALESGTPARKIAALHLCVQIDTPEATELLAAAVTDSNEGVRMRAVDCLARAGGPVAREALLDLTRQGAKRDRIRAASVLARLKPDRETGDGMIEAAAQDYDPVVSLAVARTLVLWNDRRGIEMILDLLEVPQGCERALAEEILRKVSVDCPRREHENWKSWWWRVQGKHRVPRHMTLPPIRS